VIIIDMEQFYVKHLNSEQTKLVCSNKCSNTEKTIAECFTMYWSKI